MKITNLSKFFVLLILFFSIFNGYSQSQWTSGASYNVGAEVVFESVVFKAKNSIATSYTQPKYAPNDWLVLWVDNSPWISNIYYEQGNIVLYNAIPFKAKVKISNPGCSPIDCASEWEPSSSTTNTCNPICPNFTISNGGDNTTTSYNIINNGTGGATFNFSHTVTSYQSSTAFDAQVLGEARNPSAPLVLYNNDILFRGSEEVFHGLGYYGSSYGNPNPDKKRNFANTHIDGPVLYGFNGGALGVRQYEGFKTGSTNLTKQTEKVILQWTPNLVVIGQKDRRVDLRVAGEIKCQELWVQPTTWYDNVFLPDYQLMSLDELRLFLSKHNHLPDIPSETTVKENGLAVAEYNALLLKKVEELTLYILQLEERINALESK